MFLLSTRGKTRLGYLGRIRLWSVALCGLTGCAPETPETPVKPITVAPPPIEVWDLSDQRVNPFALTNYRAMVLIFAKTDCPISRRYAPEVRRLCERFTPRGVQFRLVFADPDETPNLIRQHTNEFAYPCEAWRDPEHILVKRVGARVTPEAAVFLPAGELAYGGRIDDWYADLGQARPAPTTHDLADALEVLLANQPVRRRFVPAIGCPIADR